MSSKTNLSQRARRAGGKPIANVLMARTMAQPDLVSLAAAFVDHQSLPIEPTRQALEAVWSQPDRALAAMQYGTTIGHPPLRQTVLEQMLEADGRTAGELSLSVDQVVITTGSNQLLYLVADSLLDPGDIVICGVPSYFDVLGMLGNRGARVIGVEMDADGLIPEALQDELTRLEKAGLLDRVKLVYIVSYYDNPSGITISAERRPKLVEIAQRWSRGSTIHLIEDVAYRELRYWGEDIPSIRSFDPDGRTVSVAGSFSKSFSPGIRVGWGILAPELVEPVLSQKGNLDFGSPSFNQHLMTAVLEKGIFEAHLEKIRETYRQKIETLLEAADEHLAPIGRIEWVRPTGGLYVWLRLPEGIDTGLSGPLFDRAIAEGVLYVPGEYCYPSEGCPIARNMVRLSFGMPSREGIRRGVESLARAIRGVI